MSIHLLGERDSVVDEFAKQLEVYDAAHPAARIEIYRHSPYSIRIRVIDEGFRNKTKSMRHREVWPILYELSEETLNELSVLILIAPEEINTSRSSVEFDQPITAAV